MLLLARYARSAAIRTLNFTYFFKKFDVTIIIIIITTIIIIIVKVIVIILITCL